MGLAVEVVNGFHQTDAADLKQVVGIFAAADKFLNDRQHQSEISGNQLFPGGEVSVVILSEQLSGFFIFQHRKGGCIDAADGNFALHGTTSVL